MTANVDIVVTRPHCLGECPLWDHRNERLLWVDSLGQRVHSLDFRDGSEGSLDLPTRIGSIGLRGNGGLVAGTKDGFAVIDTDSGEMTLIAPIEMELSGNRLRATTGARWFSAALWAVSTLPGG